MSTRPMSSTRPAVSVVVCLAVVGVTFVVCARFFAADILFHDNGPETALSRFFYNLLPIGQGDQLRIIGANNLSDPPETLMPYSALFITLTTATGLPLFWRKNLK